MVNCGAITEQMGTAPIDDKIRVLCYIFALAHPTSVVQ